MRVDWPLMIIGLADGIDGATRLQKYAFMASKKFKHLRDFYSDWQPSRYGPYSAKLAEDIAALVENGYVSKERVKNELDYWVERFILTSKGSERYHQLIIDTPTHIKEFRNMIVHYDKRTIIDLLNDLYSSNPEYAVAAVKEEAGTKTYESDAYMNKDNETLA